MADIFEKWDKNIDLEGLKADIKEAAENGGKGDYKEVPHGSYEVAVEQMELKESKKGKPMVSVWFKIVAGDYKGSMLFYNQVIEQGFQIHIVNDLLRSLTSELDDCPVIEFTSYSQYADLLLDIFEKIGKNFEYGLKYTANKKNAEFHDFEITEVFVLE